MRIQIVIDDDLGDKLNKLTNKSEYIRQAISEKLARDKNQDSEKSEAKEFMDVIKNLQKTIAGNSQLLENIQEKITQQDSKIMKSYGRNKEYFEELMFEIFKINIFAVEAAGSEFIKENKFGINKAVQEKLENFVSKYS